jgi:hypothetical protein
MIYREKEGSAVVPDSKMGTSGGRRGRGGGRAVGWPRWAALCDFVSGMYSERHYRTQPPHHTAVLSFNCIRTATRVTHFLPFVLLFVVFAFAL